MTWKVPQALAMCILAMMIIPGFGAVLYAPNHKETSSKRPQLLGITKEVLDTHKRYEKAYLPCLPRAESELIEDKYKLSNFFTIKDVFLFAYFDETTINLTDAQGNLLETINLNAGEYRYKSLQSGTYFVNGTEKFSILTGDPVLDGVCGYYVLDENGFGTFTNAYTFLPVTQFPGSERTIIFATEDNTDVTVTRVDNGQILWQGTLNKGMHYANNGWSSLQININSTKPVSCLVYFDSGYYVPSTSGLFAGKEFFTYVGTVGGWYQDFTVIAYEDNTQVTIADTSTGQTYWSGVLNAGQAHTHPFINQEVYLTVTSTKNVTVCNVPHESYTTGYYHLTFVADKSGSGIGTEIISTSIDGGYLYVFGYFDDTHFSVYNAETGALVSQHTVNKGEAVNVNPGHGLWKIVSDEKPVSCLEGYMTFGSSFAWPLFGGAYPRFDIIPKPYDDGSSESLVKHVTPGGSVSYNLTVVNRYERDTLMTIDLSVDGVPENWSAWLDTYTVQLNKGGWQDIVLTVKAPDDYDVHGKLAIVNVSGVMRSDHNVTASISTYTLLDPSIKFEIQFVVDEDIFTHEKKVEAKAGERTLVEVKLENKGYLNDTYHISLEGVPSNWDVSFDDTTPNIQEIDTGMIKSKRFAPDNKETYTLFITPPPNALNGESVSITAAAVSDAGFEYLNREIEKTDSVTVEVVGEPELKLLVDEDTKYLHRGESVNYEVTVKNDGNANLNVNMLLQANADDTTYPQNDIWGAHLSLMSLNVPARTQKFLQLTVTAPLNAIADERLVVGIGAIGSVAGQSSVKAKNIQVTSIVLPDYGLNASLLSDPEQKVEAGDAVEVELTVENTGNVIETIMLGLDVAGENWKNYTYYADNYEVESIDLDMDKSESLTFSIIVPEDAILDADPDTPSIDPYLVLLNVSIDSDHYVTLPIHVYLSQHHEFAMWMQGDDHYDVQPGDIAIYTVAIENRGNWIDDVVFSIGAWPEGWTPFVSEVWTSNTYSSEIYVDFSRVVDVHNYTMEGVRIASNITEDVSSITIRMAPSQVVFVRIGFVVPFTAEEKEYKASANIKVAGGIIDDPNDNSVSMTVYVKASDPYVKDVYAPDNMEEGEIVTIKAVVSNKGDIAAKNVKVQLVVDGKPVAEETVLNLEPGGDAIVTFVWRVPKGEHDVKVQIDPEQSISEQDEGNNAKEIKVHAKAKGLFGLPGFEAYTLLIAVLGAVIATSWLRRRRE